MSEPIPSETSGSVVRPTGPLGSIVCLLALAGGWLLVFLALMQVTSIILRAIFGSPIPGDYEMIQLGTAIVVFCFLPITQLGRQNFAVTFLTDWMPRRARSRLALIGSLLMLAIALLLAWRTPIGGANLRRAADHTMILDIPIWWAFVPISFALVCLVAASVATFIQDLRGSDE